MRSSSPRSMLTPAAAILLAGATAALAPSCGSETDIPAMPVADAGYDRLGVAVGVVITLDGSGSYDPDGADLTYDWALLSRPEGSGAQVAVGADPVRPTLIPDVQGYYLVSLHVSNGQRVSRPDVVAVSATNEPPIAVAECECDPSGTAHPTEVCLSPAPPRRRCRALHGTTVDLIGTGSDDPEEGAGVLTYQWRQIRDPGECAAACPGFPSCAPPSPQTFGTAAVPVQNATLAVGRVTMPERKDEHLVYELTVSDGFATSTACVSYVVSNTAPSFFAPAGPVNANPKQEGVSFQIQCYPRDDDGDDVTVRWSQVASGAPMVAQIADPDAEQTGVVIPAGSITSNTTFEFEAEITDGIDTSTQRFTVLVNDVP